MKGVIPQAYHALLVALKKMTEGGLLQEYVFHSLWPLELLQHNPWEHMIAQLYEMIGSGDLFYSAFRNQWLHLTSSKLLESGILSQSSGESSTPGCVLEVVQHLNLPIVDLPSAYHSYFSLEQVTIDESTFTDLFFRNLESLQAILSTRCEVIRHMLEVYATEYDDGTKRSYFLDDYFKRYPCIPCTPNGIVLRKCTDVVDPTANFAPLFDSCESRFPLEDFSSRHLCYTALLELCMISEAIPFDMLVERAQTVPELYKSDKTKALSRVKLILSSKIKATEITKQDSAKISSVPFLPVLPKPPGYHLSWKGDGCELMCGRDLMIAGSQSRYSSRTDSRNPDLVGSQVAFINESSIEDGGCGYITQDSLKLLQVQKSPTFDKAVGQLTEAYQVFQSQPTTEELVSNTGRICRCVYGFLDEQLRPEVGTYTCLTQEQVQLVIPESLREVSCVWTGQHFVDAEIIAKEWSMKGPYLYPLPESLSQRRHLTAALNVKEQFTLVDVQNSLKRMKQDFKDLPVNEHCQNFLKDLVSLLLKFNPNSFVKCKLMLPDESFVLHESTKLAYNDVEWAPKDPKYTYVHSIISPYLGKLLGVKPVRSRILEKYISSQSLFRSVEFGQREELTRRIQNILRDYPFDITVLKELLQNADDAKATKMYVILDKRTHGKKGILTENWGKLQGPALIIWNDSVFAEKDLEGIQRLGLGSKRSDSETIGQYGIGFNVVYHLTDCPSFITGGETMCVFDPHCMYVHDSNELYPGRKFDGLSDGFWDNFPDMKPAYLQGGLENCPSELSGGSLFRFPLRHTKEHLKESKIIQRDTHGHPELEPLTARDMDLKLLDWAPKMKEAMLFLNHITELRFIVIEGGSSKMVTRNNYRSKVDDSAQKDRVKLHEKLAAFTNMKGNESFVIRYPLTINDVHFSYGHHSDKVVMTSEKWLIQQGVGDVENEQQTWNFIDTVKPRHGIAAPIQLPPKPKPVTTSFSAGVSSSVDKEEFSGQVFCFLPLPIPSKLPVHINGHFILDSNRRHLWRSTDSEREDDKSVWNNRIFEAIASSYANLLECAQSYYTSSEYKTWHTGKHDVSQYYNIFPHVHTLDKRYQALANSVFVKLVVHNTAMMAVISNEVSTTATNDSNKAQKTFKIEWHPPKSSTPSTQVYFWSSTSFTPSDEERKQIKPILESIGMKLTAAPNRLKDHLNKAYGKNVEGSPVLLQHTTPQTVYAYYTQFSNQASTTGQFPCALSNTVFKEVTVFKNFTKYLLQEPKKVEGIPLARTILSPGTSVLGTPKTKQSLSFPKEPFGHPLLLTADNQLRRFREDAKVIKSKFVVLFPKCQERFLHPDMLEIEYSMHYFVVCSPLSDNTYSLKLVNDILSKHLPQQLETTRLHQFEQHKILARNYLVLYWNCLSGGNVFSFHRHEILKKWALLPTKSGDLYSYSEGLVPVMPPPVPKDDEPVNPLSQKVYQVLVDVGMPFLDASIIGGVSLSCPSLDNPKSILAALFHLHEENNLSTFLTKEKVDILIAYLQSIDFRCDSTSLTYVKSLPLYHSIDDKFTTLNGKTAYVWPHRVSTIGYTKWISCSPNVVFLNGTSAWTELCSLEHLEVATISAERVYYAYIFKAFSNLTEDERYQHLEHIRVSLFPTNNIYRKSESLNEADIQYRRRATSFINGLKKLSCIGKDGETLRPVKDFCNHELEIFTTFNKHFHFLPEYFKLSKSWDDWLKFFKELGLKHTVDQDEFLDFCRETANGSQNDPVRASTVLLNHLISDSAKEAGWHTDQFFHQRVSDVAFVPTEPLSELTWIRAAIVPSNTLVVNGKYTGMAKLKEASIPDTSVLLWTVKPIVKLSGYLPLYLPDHRRLVESLGVTCEAKVSDVIHNIKNICALSRFTKFELFDQYPDIKRPPDGSKSLMDVMIKQFKFLQSKQDNITDEHLSSLRARSCIPVYGTLKATHTWQVLLVEPRCVLSYCNVSEYHPFLHCLDSQLTPMISLLQNIGVMSAIDFSHIQFVLKKAYKCSADQTLTPKTEKCVFTALRKLISLLSVPEPSNAVSTSNHFKKIGETLHPLYLPNRDGKLALSTSLLYVDSHSFKGKLNPSLEGTGYSMLRICCPKYSIFMYEKDICGLLPKNVRPRGLSEMCSQMVLDECTSVPDNEVGEALKETLSMKIILPKALVACVQYYTKERSSLEAVETSARNFLTNIEIVTLSHLRMAITFKETGEKLGNLDTRFFLNYIDTEGCCLYLDSQLKHEHNVFSPILEALSKRLLSVLRKDKPRLFDETYKDLKQLFVSLFHSKTPDAVREVLSDKSIPLEGDAMDDLAFALGKDIPECWHHRLDQTIENVFHPEEVVGYEEMEGHIVFAQIMHPILPEGVESFDSVPRISMRYRIITRSDDEEGIEVSVLKLYKFLKGLKPERVVNEDKKDLVPYEGETEPIKVQKELRRAELADIIRDLKKQLDEIWRLPENERETAIRRLYLKWHPDKNPDNPDLAEEVFKDLISEIEKRKSGKIYRGAWDRTAERQKESYAKEKASSGAGPGFGSQGWGDTSTGGAQFGGEEFRPERRPDEGRRWFKQAQANYESLVQLLYAAQSKPKVCADVCFMAHQVAEKALKGGKYFVCGLGNTALMSHNISTHAYGLQAERPGGTHGLVSHTTPLEKYYLNPRYPNRWSPPTVPADQYDYQEAEQAKNHAEAVLNIIQELFEGE